MFDAMAGILTRCSEDVRREVEASTKMLPRERYVDLDFPIFQIQCWKNQGSRKRA